MTRDLSDLQSQSQSEIKHFGEFPVNQQYEMKPEMRIQSKT